MRQNWDGSSEKLWIKIVCRKLSTKHQFTTVRKRASEGKFFFLLVLLWGSCGGEVTQCLVKNLCERSKTGKLNLKNQAFPNEPRYSVYVTPSTYTPTPFPPWSCKTFILLRFLKNKNFSYSSGTDCSLPYNFQYTPHCGAWFLVLETMQISLRRKTRKKGTKKVSLPPCPAISNAFVGTNQD